MTVIAADTAAAASQVGGRYLTISTKNRSGSRPSVRTRLRIRHVTEIRRRQTIGGKMDSCRRRRISLVFTAPCTSA